MKTKKETKSKPIKKEPISKVTLVEFTLSAVIPTLQYGNIQPSITVKADSIQDARDVVTLIIEDMYHKYSDVLPRFLKPEVKVTERKIQAETIKETVKVEPTPVQKTPEEVKPNIAAPDTSVAPAHPVNATDVPFGDNARSDAFLKAENAIKSAATAEALDVIQKAVESSVKIHADDKPKLQEIIQGRYQLINF